MVQAHTRARTGASICAHTHARSSIQSAFVRDPCNSKKRTVVGKSDGFFDGLRWAVNRGGGGRGREADGNARITPVEHIHESSLTSTPLQANDQTEPRRSPRLRTKKTVSSACSKFGHRRWSRYIYPR